VAIDEYQGVVKAMRGLEDGYDAVLAAGRVGMTAQQIDAILEERLAGHGGSFVAGKSTPFVVDARGVPPKLRLNRVPLEEGKLWAMDNSVCVDGWWADLGRYGYFGPVPDELAVAHGKVLKRQDEIARAIVPGVGMDEIYRSIGPGLGFEVHRIGSAEHLLPFCGDLIAKVRLEMEQSVREGRVFEAGMVICIELWAGLMGGIEDMYRVESGGAVRMSRLAREIRAIKV
jgi:Xaa-Pro aminopeptidase